MRQQLPQTHYLRQLIERLERVSRIMNPLLLFVAVSLVVMNLAFVVNLIDWRGSPGPAAGSAAASATDANSCNIKSPVNAAAAEPNPGTVTVRN